MARFMNYKVRIAALIFGILVCCSVRFSFAGEITSYLMPNPRNIEVLQGNYEYNSGRIICKGISKSENLNGIARLTQSYFKKAGMSMEIAGVAAKGKKQEVLLSVDPEQMAENQGYILEVHQDRIVITGHDEPGLYYGVQTLKQLLQFQEEKGFLPVLKIQDWPDYPNRGVSIDVSRDKVMKLESLFAMIDNLASWKINQIQLYTEHTFAYQNHQVAWQNYSPYTADDILRIGQYCKDRFINLVPSQNSLGHMERWLEHEEYHHIAESPEILKPGDFVLGIRRTLNATDPATLEFMEELYDELLPNFSSEYLNIGGDEPYELGLGRSKEEAEKFGKGGIYLNYLKQVNEILNSKGRKAMFWGDIILKHPELISQLPKNITCMVWGYRANHPYKKQCDKFRKAGIPYYVCPGTSSWRSVIGRIPNSLENQWNAASNGLKYGAIGYLNTDWGDHGHWQPLPVSYPAFIYGAALSWAVKENRDLNVTQVMNRCVFKDKENRLAQVIMDLGKANLEMNDHPFNMSFHQLLCNVEESISDSRFKIIAPDKTRATISYIEDNLEKLDYCRPFTKEGQLAIRELKNAGKLAIHACKLALAKFHNSDGTLKTADPEIKKQLRKDLEVIIADFRSIWGERYRIGGLHDSLEQFDEILRSYQ